MSTEEMSHEERAEVKEGLKRKKLCERLLREPKLAEECVSRLPYDEVCGILGEYDLDKQLAQIEWEEVYVI